MALGIELLPAAAIPAQAAIQTQAVDENTREITWAVAGGLRVCTERKPHPHWE